MLVTVVAWASAFVVIRALGEAFSPSPLALGRLVVGAVALGAVMLVRRAWVRPSGWERGLVAVCGVAWFAVYNVALNAAELHVNTGTAAILVNTGSILIALLAGACSARAFPAGS